MVKIESWSLAQASSPELGKPALPEGGGCNYGGSTGWPHTKARVSRLFCTALHCTGDITHRGLCFALQCTDKSALARVIVHKGSCLPSPLHCTAMGHYYTQRLVSPVSFALHCWKDLHCTALHCIVHSALGHYFTQRLMSPVSIALKYSNALHALHCTTLKDSSLQCKHHFTIQPYYFTVHCKHFAVLRLESPYKSELHCSCSWMTCVWCNRPASAISYLYPWLQAFWLNFSLQILSLRCPLALAPFSCPFIL